MQSLLTLTNGENIDFANMITRDTMDGILEKGYVKLVDFSPRIVPKGYTPEHLIVRAARASIGTGLKNIKADNALLKYLYDNHHTSPLEMCNVTLMLKLPIAIAVHFLRHRTGKFNQFSQRYAETPEDFGVYNPLTYSNGIRLQSKINKQKGIKDVNDNESIKDIMKEANNHQDSIDLLYHKLIKEHNVANEIARFWLPQSQFTILYMQFDLNNLLKLLRLRDDEHAQHETQVYASAIRELCEPLFPMIFKCFENERQGCWLSKEEVEALSTKTGLNSDSKSAQTNFEAKKRRLNF
jgi:thymidylate synthase (FAD)